MDKPLGSVYARVRKKDWIPIMTSTHLRRTWDYYEMSNFVDALALYAPQCDSDEGDS